MFHDIAPTYDRLNHLLSLNVDKRWRRFTAEKVVTPDQTRILDVCSGTGDLALAFAARASELGVQPLILSSDFTPAMCQLAKKKFAGDAGRLRPLAADTTTLPFQDNSFDLVGVAFGIRNVVDLRGALKEMVRVCRGGGQLAILEFSHPCTPVIRQLYRFYFLRVLPMIGRIISGTPAYTYLPNSVVTFPGTVEFTTILKEATAGTVQSHRLSCGIVTLYIANVQKSDAVD
jgi:demethylmenaquinone methyltransferase/2-methoxy-6-polyprenyl-1,4-benzoquinol methylase